MLPCQKTASASHHHLMRESYCFCLISFSIHDVRKTGALEVVPWHGTTNREGFHEYSFASRWRQQRPVKSADAMQRSFRNPTARSERRFGLSLEQGVM
jgi:hypothetical protein